MKNWFCTPITLIGSLILPNIQFQFYMNPIRNEMQPYDMHIIYTGVIIIRQFDEFSVKWTPNFLGHLGTKITAIENVA